MTALLVDTDQLPDLDATIGCECPGHGDGGCDSEATVLAWDVPCGHEQETLCAPCAEGIRVWVREESRPSRDGFSCEVCDSHIIDIGTRSF